MCDRKLMAAAGFCLSERTHFFSHSRRLTCFSRTLEEKCIIHLVDWSLFCSLGLIGEKVEGGL